MPSDILGKTRLSFTIEGYCANESRIEYRPENKEHIPR